MKTTLSQAFIINKLSIGVKPTLNQAGKVVFEVNPEHKPYIVFDDHRDSPVGFGVKVSLTKKTYVIQRRVASSDRNASEGKKPSSILKVKVGNVSDFPSIDQARELARQLVQTMIATKRNPTKLEEKQMILNSLSVKCLLNTANISWVDQNLPNQTLWQCWTRQKIV